MREEEEINLGLLEMVSDYSATLKLRSFAVLLGLADGGESRCNSLSSLEVELST